MCCSEHQKLLLMRKLSSRRRFSLSGCVIATQHYSLVLLRWTKFLCTMGAPTVRGSKWPQLRQTADDYAASIAQLRENRRNRESGGQGEELLELSLHRKSFQAAQQRLPTQVQEVLQEGSLIQNYKKAGVESNHRTSAATAWIVEHAGQWQLAPMACAGTLRYLAGPQSI